MRRGRKRSAKTKEKEYEEEKEYEGEEAKSARKHTPTIDDDVNTWLRDCKW